MSMRYYPPEDFSEIAGLESLTLYRFGDHLVNHWFCRTCGVYTFHEAIDRPSHFRLNLGCVDDLDVLSLRVELVDGRSF